ncbi:MAG TPA: NRDE family protein [Steroidobacteraceae bacterium]|nr:NRDE family protein [Steroidobacteraceae bacterium]
MCLVLVAWRGHAKYPCVVAANRDELHSRPAQPAHWWRSDPPILAGRDLSAGGTWLGLTRSGRFAALTNFRGSGPRRADAPSRGTLVTSILMSTETVAQSLEILRKAGPGYNAFNLMFSDGEQLAVYESVSRAGRILGPGIYGLSNHLLDTPWPKVRRAKSRLSEALSEPDSSDAALALLRDEQPAADEELPRTGISLQWERLLSSAFVRAPDYGTRCSTLVRIDESRRACFDEWTWDASGAQTGVVSLQFELE